MEIASLLASGHQNGALYDPIQYERAPLRVRCAMLRKHPPESPVLSVDRIPV